MPNDVGRKKYRVYTLYNADRDAFERVGRSEYTSADGRKKQNKTVARSTITNDHHNIVNAENFKKRHKKNTSADAEHRTGEIRNGIKPGFVYQSTKTKTGKEWDEHKYIDRVKTKDGKIRYIYPEDKNTNAELSSIKVPKSDNNVTENINKGSRQAFSRALSNINMNTISEYNNTHKEVYTPFIQNWSRRSLSSLKK